MKPQLNRRRFLRLGALAGIVSGFPVRAADTLQAQDDPGHIGDDGVKRYVRLGRTGLEIADISFGSSRLRNGEEYLVRHALDKGVNYFDTADSYTGGTSEQVIGNALKGVRDRVFIASKMKVQPYTRRQDMMQSLEQSLRRLQTDYVDIFFNHAVNDVDRLKNPEWFEFLDRAKQQGKLRFSGISGHAGRLVECLDYGLDEDMLDVILVAYNFGQDPAFYENLTRSFDFVAKQPDLPRVLEKAKRRDVGVITMKVLRGAKLNDMRPYEKGGATFAQAAFRWTLSDANVDAAIISMTSRDEIDEYLGGSGGMQVSRVDVELLEQYARLTHTTYCRHACNDCEGACPWGVPIADVLRTRMYATDYGDMEFARREYARLGNGASPCLSCDGQPCQNACTHGIPIADLCGPTHTLLG
ncbi:MAG: aldo/keto reductase [Pseudomonadales bacterium]